MWAWVRENDETLVAVYRDDEEILAEDLNGGRAESLPEDESEKEEICELKILKISKVLNTISEVMNQVERESDFGHLHLLHLKKTLRRMRRKNDISCSTNKRYRIIIKKYRLSKACV
jgi:hypothetical protein